MSVIKKKDIFSKKINESEAREDLDYFEHYDQLPSEIGEIINKYDLEEADYDMLKTLKTELNAVGWDFKYGLDAEGYDLKPIKGEIEELVNSDGTPIEGDENVGTREISTGKVQTSDDFEDSALQHRQFPWWYGSSKAHNRMPINTSYFKDGDTLLENKLKSIIEDIMTKKYSDHDFVPSSDSKLEYKVEKFLKGIELDIKELGSDEIINIINNKLNNGQ